MDDFFKDLKFQNQFDKHGYVKVKMFTEEEVNTFKAFYNSLSIHDEVKYGFSVSIDQMDDVVRMQLNTFLKNKYFHALSNFFFILNFLRVHL